MHTLLAQYPVIIEMPVAWGEMDAMGHVNNIVYFRYFESARIAYFGRLGFLATAEQTQAGPILASIQCKFKMPLTYPDTISVGARTTRIEDDRFVMEYCIVSHSAERIAAEGEGLIVAYDYHAKKKTALPDKIKRRIRELEASIKQN